MKYDWKKHVQRCLDDIAEQLPPGIVLLGVAVENVESAEGALVTSGDQRVSGVAAADVWLDVMAGAYRAYNDAFIDMEDF